MGRLVELREVISNPREYGYAPEELVKVIYEPKPEEATFVATRAMTGRESPQEICMEASLECFGVLHNGRTYLVATQNLSKELILSGETGYENSEQILTGIANLSSNVEMGAQGATWNENTIGILEKYPVIYKSIFRDFWTTIKIDRGCYGLGLYIVDSRGVLDYYLYFCGIGSASSYYLRSGVRPLVSLPSNIQISLDEIGSGALQLIKPVEQTRVIIGVEAKAIELKQLILEK